MKPVQEKILAAVQAAKRSDQWTKDGGQFIPHPATWINQGRWDDVHAAPGAQSTQPGGMNRARVFDQAKHDETMLRNQLAIGLDPYATD